MATFTIQRLATTDETAAEMDRRGAVIEKLETDLRHWREECGKLHAKLATAADKMEAPARNLRAIIAHWDEFGPEYGFGEVIDRARKACIEQ